ncbi:GNAT family N-acetyltransferase [Sphingomonas sp. R-74633]|uniref:GNAT family N-acetyltransferase n=1 Tax=Sphingomonas sp. R-74633 TaxID=2751188 RepID=UPI0015D3E139|nr:GNAT family N-acetyltransferase [Sphingomonas sp. R-74633]NYT40310.1 GNAT family N-acetyltransferase [Sphingomonas sp. R-74633]
MPPPLHNAARFSLAYRPYAAEDFDFIEALYLSTREEELALSDWPDAQKHAFLTQQHRAQHQHYQTYYPNAERLILEQGGNAIGRLYVDAWAHELRIVDISLMPAARGQGIGAAILRDVIEWAAAAGKGVSIHVEKFNPARRLYLRLGFAVAEDKGVYELMEIGTPRVAKPA